MVPIKTILVPIDFSETSSHALEYAAAVAQAFGANVTVSHSYVVPVHAASEGQGEISASELAVQVAEKAQRDLDAAVATQKERGVSCTGILTEGTACEEVARLARELLPDLIVVGAHERHTSLRAPLGSMAETLLRRASIPVLTVHADPSGA